jgi:hypothetical protein
MLKGTRRAVLQKIQPVSIHGQVSLDLYFSDPSDTSGRLEVARLGPEAVAPDLAPGDRIRVNYLVGVVTGVERCEQ